MLSGVVASAETQSPTEENRPSPLEGVVLAAGKQAGDTSMSSSSTINRAAVSLKSGYQESWDDVFTVCEAVLIWNSTFLFLRSC